MLEEDSYEERSMQGIFMEINRKFAYKCLHRIKELGVQPSQMPILMLVEKHNGCSQKEVTEMMKNKPSTVNVSISRLEKAGIVRRSRDKKDQRVTRIFLTEKGEETVRSIHRFVSETEKIVFGCFSEAEICLMRRFFRQILENIEQIPDTLENNCMT